MTQTTQPATQQQKKPSRLERLQFWKKKPEGVLKESDRFSRLGYLPYPQRYILEERLQNLTKILEEIEEEYDAVESTESKEAYAFRYIRKLFQAFMVNAGPWMRGLDNRELAQKSVAFFELEIMIGHLPAFYPDLKLCTNTLINLSWQAIDVIAETPVLMETHTTIQAGYGGVDLGGSSTDSTNQGGRNEEL